MIDVFEVVVFITRDWFHYSRDIIPRNDPSLIIESKSDVTKEWRAEYDVVSALSSTKAVTLIGFADEKSGRQTRNVAVCLMLVLPYRPLTYELVGVVEWSTFFNVSFEIKLLLAPVSRRPRTVDYFLALDELWDTMRTRTSDPLAWAEGLFCKSSEILNFFMIASSSFTPWFTSSAVRTYNSSSIA